ncbi:ribonuclease T2 family protein [Dongshaea marina]|uniref:ribonuclease T2 family protein n=1 Tax=Dongshaea marina TaxID=2047966 RepID=UPI000D3ED263|nr:ribonuclease [Dongshaea marina]
MKKTLLACALTLPLLGLSGASMAASDTPVAGRFDYYVLALSVQPVFCATHQSKAECKTSSSAIKNYRSYHLSLHGFWPNKLGDASHSYGYCGVNQENIEKDKLHQWEKLPKLELSPSVRSELDLVMPGTQSNLQRHEWYKHGTCSKMSSDSYFQKSVQLVNYFNDSPFSQYLDDNIGKSVKRNAILNKFNEVYGPNASEHLLLSCKKLDGVEYLSGLSIYLRKDVDVHKEGQQQLFPDLQDPIYGRCDSTITIYDPDNPA